MNYYLDVLKKYTDFTGRARRAEYWYFVLFNILVSFVVGFVDGIFGTFPAEGGLGLLGTIYALAVFLPSVAVAARRLHDTGRSGWWQLILFIPIIGAIVLIVFLVQDSHPNENEYGENPLLDSTSLPRHRILTDDERA